MILLLILLWTAGLEHEDDAYFNQLLKIGTAGEYTYAVQNGNDYMLSLMDEHHNMVREFVRKGEGPGELAQVDAVTFSAETNHFYLIGRGKLLVLGLDGGVVQEEQMGFLNANDAIFSEGKLYIGIMDLMPTGDLRDVSAVLVYDVQEGSSEYVSVPYDHLTISPANKIGEIGFMRFLTRLTLFEGELYFVLNGNPVVYKLSGAEAEVFYESSSFSDEAFVISYNDRFGTYGFRTPSVFNSLLSTDEYLLLTNGNLNDHVNIEHSVYAINMKTGDSQIWNSTGDTSDIICLNASYARDHLYFHDCSFQVGYTVTKRSLVDLFGGNTKK